ncbi:steroid 17alpha-monooxygenase or 17alpha-hydroxyprogesterone aldolase [Spatholobus suberectus]|nr:steroid 17alpha-monooxygenase or 17alpha-hydroxyprogesterone aldolase [Spatholobus suberectus]
MELNRTPFSIYFITSIPFLFMLFILVQRPGSDNSSSNLSPGPRALPFIGNIHQLVGSLPHQCLKNLADKDGPLMHLKLGEVSNITVTSPEMAQEIMKTHDLNGASIAFSQPGDYWRVHFNLSQNIYPFIYGIAARVPLGKKSRCQQVFVSKIEEQLKHVAGETDRVLQDISDEHKNRKSSECEAVQDLVDVLLKFKPDKETECPLIDDNIKGVIQV